MPEDEHTLKQLWQAAIDSGKPTHSTKEPTQAIMDGLILGKFDPNEPKKPTTITPAMKAEKKVLADMRREEAEQLLLWLNNNGCLSTSYGTMDKALEAIKRGEHRR